ncbi:MAG: hypothetical protein ACTH0V_02735 [Microbacteriaceae bacterium]
MEQQRLQGLSRKMMKIEIDPHHHALVSNPFADDNRVQEATSDE